MPVITCSSALGFIVLLLLLPLAAFALEPAEVAVVANKFVTGSVDLAHYYMEKRGIPKANLIRIDTTNKEWVSRKNYDEEIAAPVRQFLRSRKEKSVIRCLVTVQGVPLRVEPPEMTREEKRQVEKLNEELAIISEQLTSHEKNSPQAVELNQRYSVAEKQRSLLQKKDQRASVDSELSLVLVDVYPLDGWVTNPYFTGFQQKRLSVTKDEVLMVARLDAPSVDIVRRMIDDSLAIEAAGLNGTAYIDARYPKPDPQKKLEGYAFYDNSLHLAAERIKSSRMMPVVVNDKAELFQAGEAPNAALYCGWYSLSRYVDAFDWQRGAVGYHIASGECGTLCSGTSQGWCKRMLEDGAAATVGPVSEPYVTAFPVPEIFFPVLIDGYYTLAEAYFLSLPYLSWQMVLVGDPLYRPFKVRHVME